MTFFLLACFTTSHWKWEENSLRSLRARSSWRTGLCVGVLLRHELLLLDLKRIRLAAVLVSFIWLLVFSSLKTKKHPSFKSFRTWCLDCIKREENHLCCGENLVLCLSIKKHFTALQTKQNTTLVSSWFKGKNVCFYSL